MSRYIFRKALIFLSSLFIVITVTFFFMKAIPGDPFAHEQDIPKEILDSLYEHYGLNKPLFTQYLLYLKGFCLGDFGSSFIYPGRTVNQILKEAFPISAILGLQALLFSFILGVTSGSIAALFHGKWQDNAAILLTIVGISLPNFVLATLMQYIFCMKLHLLPIARWGSFSHTILPTIALSVFPTAFIAQLTRSNLIEVLQQDYIKTAYAKGVQKHRILIEHALRNAILPVIGYLGPISAHILTGSFVVEKIFGIPGLGQWMIMSIMSRDYTIIMGLTVFFSMVLIGMNFLVDLVYSLIDPRIKITESRTRYDRLERSF